MTTDQGGVGGTREPGGAARPMVSGGAEGGRSQGGSPTPDDGFPSSSIQWCLGGLLDDGNCHDPEQAVISPCSPRLVTH